MATDPSIILAAKPAPLYSAFSQGQLAAQQLAQQQEASKQQQLGTQQQQLALEQQQLQRAFVEWDNAHELTQDPQTGEINVQKYIEDATKAGFGAFARQAVQELQQAKSSIQGGAATQQDQIKKILIDAANGMQGMNPQQRAATIAQTRDTVLRNFKVDINQMYGQNWPEQMFGAQYTPEAFQKRETQYATPEGRDPNSQQSRSLRAQLNNMGASIPENVSAFEIYNNPIYQQLIDQISTGTRVEAVGKVAAAEQQRESVNSLITRIDDLKKANLVRPGELLLNAIERLTNTPEGARLEAVVADLAKQGITVTPQTNLAGARESLQGVLGAIEQGQAGQKAIAGARTIPTALETAPIAKPQKAPSGMVEVTVKSTGQKIYVTPAQVKIIKSHKNAANFEIK